MATHREKQALSASSICAVPVHPELHLHVHDIPFETKSPLSHWPLPLVTKENTINPDGMKRLRVICVKIVLAYGNRHVQDIWAQSDVTNASTNTAWNSVRGYVRKEEESIPTVFTSLSSHLGGIDLLQPQKIIKTRETWEMFGSMTKWWNFDGRIL